MDYKARYEHVMALKIRTTRFFAAIQFCYEDITRGELAPRRAYREKRRGGPRFVKSLLGVPKKKGHVIKKVLPHNHPLLHPSLQSSYAVSFRCLLGPLLE